MFSVRMGFFFSRVQSRASRKKGRSWAKCSATWCLVVPCMRALWLWASLGYSCLGQLSRRAGGGFKVVDIEDHGHAAEVPEGIFQRA